MSETDKNPPSTASDATQNDILSELLSKLSGSASRQTSPEPNDGASPVFERTAPPSSDLFSALLSNPELVSKLPSLISSIKPVIEMLSSGGFSTGGTQTSEKQPQGDSISVGNMQHKPAASHKNSDDSRAALLCAMKPYLSQDRQNAIDYIIKISRLGDILKTL